MTMTDDADVATSEVRRQSIRTARAERDRRHVERKRSVIELRRAGATFDEAGQALGISGTAARNLYRSALKDHYREGAIEERETALLRCDGIIKRWWPKLLSPDDDVADQATRNLFRAMDFQADLWGMKRSNVDVRVSGQVSMPTGNEVWQALTAFRERALADGDTTPPAAIDVVAALSNGTTANGSTAVQPGTNGHDG